MCDKAFHRLVSNINSTLDERLHSWVGDRLEDVSYEIWIDSEWSNDKDAKSVSGVFSALAGGNALATVAGSATKQTSIATSTPEAEIVTAFTGLKANGVPALELWETLLGRKPLHVQLYGGNEACLQMMKSGEYHTMRHLSRTQKIDIRFLHDQ